MDTVVDFESTCRPHRQALYTYACKFTGQQHNAEDLVQETLLRAYTYWSQYNPELDVLVWLKKILANTFYTAYRKDKRYQDMLDGYQEESEHITHNDEPEDFTDNMQALIDRLKPDYKELVVLHYLQGKTYLEIAATLQIHWTKVQKRLWRARQSLREMISNSNTRVVNATTLKSSKRKEADPDSVNSVM